jgi:hypothetical protein
VLVWDAAEAGRREHDSTQSALVVHRSLHPLLSSVTGRTLCVGGWLAGSPL